MSSIPVAYCIDLDEIVSISEARREYFRQPEPRQKFNFYCPDPSCKQKNGKRTQISAPNLYLPLFDPEHKKSRAPHFKIYQNQVHINECESIQYSQQNIIKDKDMSNALTTRSKHIKDNDYIDVFYRPGTKKSYAISIDKTAQGIHGTDITRTITSKVRGDSTRALSEKPSKTSTTFLMTLLFSFTTIFTYGNGSLVFLSITFPEILPVFSRRGFLVTVCACNENTVAIKQIKINLIFMIDCDLIDDLCLI